MTTKQAKRAAQLKHVIASPSTCTTATLKDLAQVLGNESQLLASEKSSQNGNRRPKPQEPATGTSAPLGRRTKRRPEVAILEECEASKVHLQPQEKFRLATEVVNITLKALTEALRAAQSLSFQHSTKSSYKRQSDPRLTGTLPLDDKEPLKARCANRLSKSPLEASGSQQSLPCVTAEHGSGILVQAECARVAFAALRDVQGHKDFKMEMPPLQLEMGMSALIGKLIGLGLEDPATKELRILRKRLAILSKSDYEKLGPGVLKSDTGKEKDSATMRETLADLMQFDDNIVSEPVLALVITTQLHVLKLIALRKRPTTIEAAFTHLMLSVRYSPANLIEKLGSLKSPNTREKAANQLETLARSLLSLCPGVSTAEDDVAADVRKSISPDSCLRYQQLALEIRMKWWKLADHRRDVQHELLDPLAQYLRSFSRRSTLKVEEKYKLAQDTFSACTAGLCLDMPLEFSLKGSKGSSVLIIYQVFADLARGSLRFDEGIEWMRKLSSVLVSVGASQIRICTATCVQATFALQSPSIKISDEALLPVLQEAAVRLNSNLHGDSTDLDELLLAVNNLRKATLSFLAQRATPSGCTFSELPAAVISHCLELMLLSLKFIIRFIGKDPGADAKSNSQIRFEHRRRLVVKIAKPTIDSIIAISKLPMSWDTEIWQKIDTGLQSCSSLASILEGCGSIGESPLQTQESGRSPFVMLSSVYWYRFVKLKQRSDGSAELRSTLRRSVDVIKHRSIQEKIAGVFAIKLENLGVLYESSGEHSKARITYAEALRSQIDAGILHNEASISSSSLNQAIEKNDSLGFLCRLLHAYCRISIKTSTKAESVNLVFDDDQLSPGQRGFLLECQFSTVASLVLDRRPSEDVHNVFNNLAASLLHIYTETEYPIRRLRVKTCLLQVQSTHPALFESTTMDQVLHKYDNAAPSAYGADTGLKGFLAHLLTCYDVCMAFFLALPKEDDLKPALISWSNIVQTCSDLRSLEDQVSDVPNWLLQLQSIADYCDAQGFEFERLSILHILTTVHGMQTTAQPSQRLSALTALGLQFVRLGHSHEASLVLQRAERHADVSDTPEETMLRCYLAYAEYLISIGNVSKSEEYVAKADTLLKVIIRCQGSNKNPSIEKYNLVTVAGDMNHVLSLLASARGQKTEALFYGRKALMFSHRAWAILEHCNMKHLLHSSIQDSESDLELATDNMSALSLKMQSTPVMSTKHASLKTAAFWPLVPSLFRRLLYLSQLVTHSGMFQEAIHYIQQALKVANAVSSMVLRGRCHAGIGNLQIRSGQADHGSVELETARDMTSNHRQSQSYAMLHLYLANGYAVKSQWEEEARALKVARDTLSELITVKPLSTPSCMPCTGLNELSGRMQKLNMQDVAPKASRTAKRLHIEKSARRRSPARKVPESVDKKVPATDSQPLLQLQGQIIRQQARSALYRKNTERAAMYLTEICDLPMTKHDLILQALTTADLLSHQGLECMSGDPVFSVLPESTTSCPSIHVSGRRQSKELLAPMVNELSNRSQLTIAKAVPSSKPVIKKKPHASNEFSNLLKKASETMIGIHVLAQSACSSSELHAVSNVLSKILIMLSATGASSELGSVSSRFVAYAMEMGRNIAMLRGKSAIRVERALSAEQDLQRKFKEQDFHLEKDILNEESIDLTDFQTDYIDIIPVSWVVISISINEDHDELRIAKIRSGQSPFVLIIPLNRHNSRDADEKSFGFSEGRAELLDVIGLANYSTHGAQDMSRKGAKAEWWEARAALDARLRDLLYNIENIWLGGFRGIFTTRICHPALLSRFQRSLYNILEKHLPSRQKQSTAEKAARLSLDSRVLELFVGLGNPIKGFELDEPLMDLLYFVVDILQFHGERNAYDEIDFDSIAIETIDVLRHYHEAIHEEAQTDGDSHVILVLDKALHCFPWESLPCLAGQAVSRVPSLQCIRDRILQQQHKRDHDQGSDRFCVSRDSGGYFLNPSGDLKATQATFEGPLQVLDSWSAVIDREPSEAELKSSHEKQDIVVYFGHGSGGQYIRPRTIRKLDKCAVTLLMGCSSGALAEAGEFEPFGTPMNYMHAGCPALLATLWDVTDKDIDRFSLTVLETWGLFLKPEESRSRSPIKKSARKRGKGKSRDDHNSAMAAVSLDQAVAFGRNSCILRYLNGAAPVIYGVPIFLN